MNENICYKLFNLDTKEYSDEIYLDEYNAEKDCDRANFHGHNVAVSKMKLIPLKDIKFNVYKIFDRLSDNYSPINRIFTDLDTAKELCEWCEDLEVHEFELVFKGIKSGK